MPSSFWTVLSKVINPAETRHANRAKITMAYCHSLKDQGVITQTVNPGVRGRVLFQATTWFAICPHTTVLSPQTFVRVIGQYNATTLIVEPIHPMTSPSAAIEQVS
jgi:hypothetical protein